MNVKHDITKSIHYYSLAAYKHDPLALYRLGAIHFIGNDVDFNITKAFHYLTLSANQNCILAQYVLGELYFIDDFFPCPKKAIFYLTLAANSRFPLAILKLGILFHEGEYVPIDIQKAVHYYKEISSLNDAYAKNNLGVIYKRGYRNEIPQRISQAIEYFSEAIKYKNDKLATYNLAHIFFYGEESIYDLDKAISILVKGLNEFYASYALLCLAIVKKHESITFKLIQNEINKYKSDSYEIVCRLYDVIKGLKLENKETYEYYYKLYKFNDYLYEYNLNYVSSIQFGSINNLPKNEKQIDINDIFYEGFGINEK